MESREMGDAHGRSVKVEANMGTDLTIYLEDRLTDDVFQKSIHFTLRAARDSLEFCEWCLTQAAKTARGDIIEARSITILYDGVGYSPIEEDNVMRVTTELEARKFVTIRNQFPDADSRVFKSQVRYLLLDSLREAVSFGEQCYQEHKTLMESHSGRVS